MYSNVYYRLLIPYDAVIKVSIIYLYIYLWIKSISHESVQLQYKGSIWQKMTSIAVVFLSEVGEHILLHHNFSYHLIDLDCIMGSR